MTYIVSSGALNSTHSLTHQRTKFDDNPPIHGIEMDEIQNGGRLHLEFCLDGILVT